MFLNISYQMRLGLLFVLQVPEPKIKFYIATVGNNSEDAQVKITNIEKEINDFVG